MVKPPTRFSFDESHVTMAGRKKKSRENKKVEESKKKDNERKKEYPLIEQCKALM